MNYTGRAPIRQPVPESSEHDISPSCLDRSHAGTRRRINCLSRIPRSRSIPHAEISRQSQNLVGRPARVHLGKRRTESFVILRKSDRQRQILR
jgi:hypothetical protein